MEWVPYSPDALIDTGDRLANLPVLLSIRIPQQLRLLPYSVIQEVLYTYASLGTVDVMCDDNRVSSGPWCDLVYVRFRDDGDGWSRAGRTENSI
jgi:hypothetical protein